MSLNPLVSASNEHEACTPSRSPLRCHLRIAHVSKKKACCASRYATATCLPTDAANSSTCGKRDGWQTSMRAATRRQKSDGGHCERARVHVRTALRTALWSLRRLPSACTAQSWPHLCETAAALPCRFVSGSVSHALSHCTHLYSAHPFHGQPHWHVENLHSSSLSTARIDTAGKRSEA